MDLETPGLDLRAAGLFALLNARNGRDIDAILSRHPQRLAIAAAPNSRISLEDVMRAELAREEARVVTRAAETGWAEWRSPAEYFLRRRKIARIQELKVQQSALPAVWSILVVLPRGDVVRRSIDIGIELIGVGLRSAAAEALPRLLAPLGRDLGLRAAEQRERQFSRPVDPLLERMLRAAYEGASSERKQARLASFLGRRALGTLFRRLPETERASAAEICRSSLIQNIAEIVPLPVARAADVDMLATVVDRAIVGCFTPRQRGGGS